MTTDDLFRELLRRRLPVTVPVFEGVGLLYPGWPDYLGDTHAVYLLKGKPRPFVVCRWRKRGKQWRFAEEMARDLDEVVSLLEAFSVPEVATERS